MKHVKAMKSMKTEGMRKADDRARALQTTRSI